MQISRGRAQYGQQGPNTILPDKAKNDTRILLEIYEKVQKNESKNSDSNKEQADQEILLDLMERAKNPSKKVQETNVKRQREDILPRKKRRRVTIIRKGKSADYEPFRSLKRRRKPSHVKLYWDKRLEMASKNVMSEALFRDEYKVTTPPPTRKGEGAQYKPTTGKPPDEHTDTTHYNTDINNNISEHLADIEDTFNLSNIAVEDNLEDIPVEVSAMVAHSLREKENEQRRPERNESFIEPSYHKPSYYNSPVFPNFPQITETYNPKYRFQKKNLAKKKYIAPRTEEKKETQAAKSKASFTKQVSGGSNIENLSYSPLAASNMISKPIYSNPINQLTYVTNPEKPEHAYLSDQEGYNSLSDQSKLRNIVDPAKHAVTTDLPEYAQYQLRVATPVTNITTTQPPVPSTNQGYQSSTLPPQSRTIKPFLTSNYPTVYQPINSPPHQLVTNTTPLPTDLSDNARELSKLLFNPGNLTELPKREKEKDAMSDEIFNEHIAPHPNSIDKRKSKLYRHNLAHRFSKTKGYSEPSSRFVTTALPKHGPTNVYGYATRHSFVNVQFGGNIAVNKAYPFAQNLGINRDKSYRTLNTLPVYTTPPPPPPTPASAPTPAPTPTPPPTIAPTPKPASAPASIFSNHWKEYSKFHMAANQDQHHAPKLTFSPVHDIEHKKLPLAHFPSPRPQQITHFTPLPPVLPPLTHTIRKLNQHIHQGVQSYQKIPSIRFDQEVVRKNQSPVTLPPYIGNIPNPHQDINANYFRPRATRKLTFPDESNYGHYAETQHHYETDQIKRAVKNSDNYHSSILNDSTKPLNTPPDNLILSSRSSNSLPASETPSHALDPYNLNQLVAKSGLTYSQGMHEHGKTVDYKPKPAIHFVDDDINTPNEDTARTAQVQCI